MDLVSANSTTKSVEKLRQSRAFVKYAVSLHLKKYEKKIAKQKSYRF